MEFIEEQGEGYLAHVMGRLYDRFLRAFEEWYPEFGVVAPARTHSTMHALHEYGSLGVTEIASLIRQSHPLVIKWVRELTTLGLVTSSADPQDARRTILRLTEAGQRDFESQQAARVVTGRAFRSLSKEVGAEDLFDVLWRMEKTLQKEPFAERLRRLS